MHNNPLKLLGRHTGESHVVFLLHCFRYSGGDLRIFLTPNFSQNAGSKNEKWPNEQP
jgi:hypothetical protein